MKPRTLRLLTAVVGVLAGGSAVAGGLVARAGQPEFGIPAFFGLYADHLSGVHVLVGLGVVMVVGGLVSVRWPSVGAVVVLVATCIGMVYVYDRGQYRWVPMLYYWAAPWVLAWLAGIFAGLLLSRTTEQHGGVEAGGGADGAAAGGSAGAAA